MPFTDAEVDAHIANKTTRWTVEGYHPRKHVATSKGGITDGRQTFPTLLDQHGEAFNPNISFTTAEAAFAAALEEIDHAIGQIEAQERTLAARKRHLLDTKASVEQRKASGYTG